MYIRVVDRTLVRTGCVCSIGKQNRWGTGNMSSIEKVIEKVVVHRKWEIEV